MMSDSEALDRIALLMRVVNQEGSTLSILGHIVVSNILIATGRDAGLD